MKDFVFRFPTEIVFGRGAEEQAGVYASRCGRRAMILYGSERIRKNGLFDRIAGRLKESGLSVCALGGIAENPILSKAEEAVRAAREQKADILIAVGGGSVIDTAKAVAVGYGYDGALWDLYAQKARPKEALPIGVVLTMAATASEANGVSVLWNKEENVKCALSDPLMVPRFALMNPELTYTVPARQTAAGSLDIFAHAFERYIVREQQGTLRDHLCESVMKTVIEELPAVLAQPDSYEHRSQLMWAATMAHSDMIGKEGDFACHALSHIFTAEYGLSHGGALAVIMPAWCRLTGEREPEAAAKFFRRVWGCGEEEASSCIQKGVEMFRGFVRECGLPTTLSEAGIPTPAPEEIRRLALLTVKRADGFVGGGFSRLYREDVCRLIGYCV